MSKLYNKYLILKAKYPDSFLLFNNGLFYIFLDEDAKIVSQNLGLKLTNLNGTIVKCGFPVDQISKYNNILKAFNINFKIIENDFTVIDDSTDYLNNNIFKKVIDKIENIDLDSTSPIKALNILTEFKEIIESGKN